MGRKSKHDIAAAKVADGTVVSQIDALQRLTMAQLRERWSDLFGNEPPRAGRAYLLRRLAYRIQELRFGGLSAEVRQELAKARHSQTERPGPSQKTGLQPGTRLLRDWHDERYEVVVQQSGFLYNGQMYKSLSGVARAITGSNWDGYRFFGLKNARPKRRQA